MYTKGPWVTDLTIDAIFKEDGHIESLIEITNEDHSETIGYATTEANARLISVAPDLFKLLDELLTLADRGTYLDLSYTAATPISRKIREAISKAEKGA